MKFDKKKDFVCGQFFDVITTLKHASGKHTGKILIYQVMKLKNKITYKVINTVCKIGGKDIFSKRELIKKWGYPDGFVDNNTLQWVYYEQ